MMMMMMRGSTLSSSVSSQKNHNVQFKSQDQPEFTEIESKVVPVKTKKQEKIEDVDVRNFFLNFLKSSHSHLFKHKHLNSSLINH